MKSIRDVPPRRTARLAVAAAATVAGAVLLGAVLTLPTGPLLAVAAGLVVAIAGLILGLPLLDRLAARQPRPDSTAPADRSHPSRLVSRR